MARSLIATEIGVKRAKEALIDLGITQTVLAEKRLKYSRSTVSNFFNRKPIAHENFTEICKILKLEWRDIAEIAEGEATQDDVESSAPDTSSKSARQEFQKIDDKVKQVEKQIRLAFAIAGTVDQVDEAKLNAIVKLLRQITGDASIEIVDIQEGSIKLILIGTPEALVKIQTLYRSQELKEIVDTEVVSAQLENLRGIDLTGLDLSGANFRGDDLRGINLSGTNLRGSDFSGKAVETFLNEVERYSSRVRIPKQLLSDDPSARLRFSSWNPSDPFQKGANLSRANLSETDFIEANLSMAELNGANLQFANLSGANIRGANLRRAFLKYADLSKANLTDADLTDAILSSADLTDTILRGSNLTGINLSSVDLRTVDIKDAIFRRANLTRANLSGTDFRYVDLRGANLSRVDLSQTNLRGADLSMTNLRNVNLGEAKFTLRVSSRREGIFILRKFHLKGAVLNGSNLRGTDLRKFNLRGVCLEGSDLRSADIRGANLNGAALTDAILRGANLSKADLRYADLSGAKLKGAIVRLTKFGNNAGISQVVKQALISRGANFYD